MFDLDSFDFTNKKVLEVGSGRGGTTLELGKLIKNFHGAKLIATDIYDKNFEKINLKLKDINLDATFIKTDACELEGIEENSIDLLVCNYTLCAINSISGCGFLALNKFKKVLKENGILYIEEEYPINMVDNPMQEVWSRKWQILRSISMLLGELSYNEIKPDILEKYLYIQGFTNIQWENQCTQILGETCLDFFKYRFNKLLDKIDNSNLVRGLKGETKSLEDFAKEVGGMEIPSYKIVAVNKM